jgi:hypothetical protein
MPNGKLNLELVDVYGDGIVEAVDINLYNQGLAERLVVRDVDASKKMSLTNLQSGPNGLYRIEIDPRSYLPVNRFVTIPSGRPAELVVKCPVDHTKVIRVEFPAFGSLDEQYARILDASTGVLGFGGIAGQDLYDSLDELRKAGMMNILAKSARTRFPDAKGVIDYLLSIYELRQDRFFAAVAKELRDATKNAVASGLFRAVSGALHSAPAGFQSAGSFKTDDSYGNLQLTFWNSGDTWMADIDIDDAAGLEHVFQVLRNTLTGRPTHPYDIHEILIAHQELDPGYRLIVREPKPKVKTARG